MRSISIIIIALMAFVGKVKSQDCNSPLTLCSEELQSITAADFSGAFNETCFSSLSSVFFDFTTNNNVTNTSAFLPYEVNADVSIANCIDAGVDIPVTIGIYQANTPGFNCGPLTEIAPCVSGTDALTINSGDLQPNTQYLLVVGIDPMSTGFTCDIDVTLTGTPLGINAFQDDEISLGESSQLIVFGATEEFGVENYVWSPVESLDDFQAISPVATPTNTTTYTVEAEVGDCMVTDEVIIRVREAVTVLNTFSPNGDGINDTWRILRIEDFDSALINVYDRWGQLVHKSIGYSSPWDGTNEGKKLSTGTYYYVIELNSIDIISEPLTGFVVILN